TPAANTMTRASTATMRTMRCESCAFIGGLLRTGPSDRAAPAPRRPRARGPRRAGRRTQRRRPAGRPVSAGRGRRAARRRRRGRTAPRCRRARGGTTARASAPACHARRAVPARAAPAHGSAPSAASAGWDPPRASAARDRPARPSSPLLERGLPAEHLAQCVAYLEQQCARCARPDVQELRDLGVALALEIVEHYHRALPFREQGQRADEPLPNPAALRVALGILPVRRQAQPIQRDRGAHAAPPLHVERPIADDPEEPGPEPLRRATLVQPLQRTDERVLDAVLRVVRTAEQRERQPVRRVEVALGQFVEGRRIAPPGALDQPLIGGRLHLRTRHLRRPERYSVASAESRTASAAAPDGGPRL